MRHARSERGSRPVSRRASGLAAGIGAGLLVALALALALAARQHPGTLPAGLRGASLLAKGTLMSAAAPLAEALDPRLAEIGPRTPLDGAGFRYEDLAHPGFADIRGDPRLERLYGAAPPDVEAAARMADFLRDLAPHGVPETATVGRELAALLDAAERGERFQCQTLSRMLAQMLQAGGTPARRLRLGGHVVTELWSRRHQKWVVMDADYNVHFTSAAGVPLSGRELRELARAGRESEIVARPGSSPHTLYAPDRKALLLGLYEDGFAVDFYARWTSLALPRWHPRRSPSQSAVFLGEPDGATRLYLRHSAGDPELLYAPPPGLGAPPPR